MIGIVNEWEIMDELDGMDYHIINSDDKYIVLKDDGFLPDYMISQ